jgi:L-gulonolactone oxidase
MKDTVCVTGGSGGIGQALLEQLVGHYHLRALFRTKTAVSDAWVRRGCEAVWGDLTDEAALAELAAGARFVFHCAALIQGAYEAARAVNVEGTRRLARVAAAHACERFVHVSSVAVYGFVPGRADCLEDTALVESEDLGAYGLTKLQAEAALREVANEHGLAFTIVRPTCVYGPNTKPYTQIPIALIRRGIPVVVGDGHGLIDAVYVDDVARALVLAARSPAAAGEAFNLGHETVTLDDFYAHYGRMLNRRPSHLPVAVINTVLGMLNTLPATVWPQLRRGGVFLLGMADNKQGFPSAKAYAAFGYAPEVGLATGMLETEIWAKRRGFIPRTAYTVTAYSPGPIPFSPLSMVHPETEEDLVRCTNIARKHGITAKAIGSLHSLSPIPETEGLSIVLDRYNRLLRVEGTLVTVQAGMTLRALNEALAGVNLAMPILGAIAEQTVAGAISTATHGGSLHLGSISDAVEAVRVVRADGLVLDIDRAHELFPALAVSLGVLGILSTVTFRCVPAFALQSRSTVSPADRVLGEFDDLNRRNLFVDMLYFPVTDEIEVLSMNRIAGDESALAGRAAPPLRPPSAVLDSVIVRRLRTRGLQALAWLLLRSRPLQRRFTRLGVGGSYKPRSGRSDQVLAFGDQGTLTRSPMMLLLHGLEVAVPYAQGRTAIGVLRDHFRATGKYPLLPIHIRTSARSDLWLSPAYDRDVCWLEFWLCPSDNLSMAQIHVLLEPFRYRFHWGKGAPATRAYISRQYEQWHAFEQLREAWDPAGMFLNSYLQTFFGRREDGRPV